VTYSILASDESEVGVAVQSQAFNAGAAVAWARPGAGAIATQAFTDRRYGYAGLDLLASGVSAATALAELLAADAQREIRQVALLDLSGAIAQHTGAACVPSAGHAAGQGWAAQGNMLAAEAWHAMGAAFEATEGTLAGRLMAALEAAEEAGGDWRGRGGAGIVVVPRSGDPWERVVDLRVEEGEESLGELRRLVERAEGYRAANRARPAAPVARAAGLPEQHVLWLSLLDAAGSGDIATGRRILAELESRHPRWRVFARSLAAVPELRSLEVILQAR
jgi:uncharacterized Ntn-hydrolase superfamily protein